MAQRLATEYKNVTLSLSKDQVTQFFRLFRVNNARIEEKVLDNGDIEVSLLDERNQFNLTIAQSDGSYTITGNGMFKDRAFAEVMRKAMLEFKGKAIVYRIFQSFIIEYCYELGTVASIRELNGDENNIIFENTDFSFTLQKIYANKSVEKEISSLRQRVDQLLDQRNTVADNGSTHVQRIDQHLHKHSRRLNQLEA